MSYRNPLTPRSCGAAIRAMRQRAKLGQKQLARLVDYDVSTVSDWERGVHNPPLRVFIKVAGICGCTIHIVQEEKP